MDRLITSLPRVISTKRLVSGQRFIVRISVEKNKLLRPFYCCVLLCLALSFLYRYHAARTLLVLFLTSEREAMPALYKDQTADCKFAAGSCVKW